MTQCFLLIAKLILLALQWDPESSDEEEDIDETFEFLPLSWLTKWLSNPATCGPMDTSLLLCQHNRLDIDKLSEVKICDAETARYTFDNFVFDILLKPP